MTTANFYIGRAWTCLRNEGFQKKGASFYKSSDEVAVVINFQKSRFGEGYYLNFGIWIKSLAPIQDYASIKENKCHITIRMESLFPEFAYTIRLLADRSRLRDEELKQLDTSFHEIFGPAFKERVTVCLSIMGLKKMFSSGMFAGGLVRKEAKEYLASCPINRT